jgi:hypothetical protein
VEYATTNECYNEQLSIKSGCYNEHRRYNESFIIKAGCYKHRCYNKRILKRTVFINKIRMLQRTQTLQQTNSTTNSLLNKIRILQRTQMLQRTNATTNSFINKIRMLQLTPDPTTNNCYNEQFSSLKQDATTNEIYNEQFLSIKSGCYNECRCYKERMLQRTVFSTKSECYNERGGILSADVERECG